MQESRLKPLTVRIGRKSARIVLITVLIVLMAGFLFPMALTIANSFMAETEITSNYAALSGDTDDSQPTSQQTDNPTDQHPTPQHPNTSNAFALQPPHNKQISALRFSVSG